MFNQISNDTKLYDILGISKHDADDKIMKKKYRKLAMKWHPDKNQHNKKEAEKRFKEINHAYSILSDPDKRKIYDQFGEEALNNNTGDQQQNPFDFFSNIFNNRSEPNPRNSERKPDVEVINVELYDFYTGKKIKHSYKKKIMVNKYGKEDKTGYNKCVNCNGSGKVKIVKQLGPNIIQRIQTSCNICNGVGMGVKNGFKFIIKDFNIEFKIEKGMGDNQRIMINNGGNYDPINETYNDLLIVIKEINNKFTNFKREGHNLIYECDIDLFTSLVGNNINIKRLDGKILAVALDRIIKPDMISIIKNEGMPIINTNKFGDLYVKFNVIFPNKLSIKEKNAMRENYVIKDDPIPVGAKICLLMDYNKNTERQGNRTSNINLNMNTNGIQQECTHQ